MCFSKNRCIILGHSVIDGIYVYHLTVAFSTVSKVFSFLSLILWGNYFEVI